MELEEKRLYDRTYYANMNVEKKIKRQQLQLERRRRNKKFIQYFKSRHSCKICGESEPVCLDFHHINGKKENNIADASGWSMDRLMSEINKCVLVCANCHRLLHANIVTMVL